jgi:hypothetical protein
MSIATALRSNRIADRRAALEILSIRAQINAVRLADQRRCGKRSAGKSVRVVR